MESLINVDFRKKIWIASFFNFTKENCKNDRENDHAPFRQTNELIGYQNWADFCEIWPKRSLDVVKQKCVGDFEIYNISPVAIFNAMPMAHSLLLELDRLIKK